MDVLLFQLKSKGLFFIVSIFLVILCVVFKCNAGEVGYINKHIAIYGDSSLLKQYDKRIAKEYNILITEWWKHREVSRIKSLNPQIRVLFYRDLIGIRTDYDDWSIVKRHEDWFVRDVGTGKRVRHRTFGWYLVDLTKEGFKRHLLKYIKEKLKKHRSFAGVFLDDVPMVVDQKKFYAEGSITRSYPRFSPQFIAKYHQCVKEYLKELKNALGAKLLFINTNDRNDFVQHVDGIMFEGFVHGSWQEKDYFSTLANWRNDIIELQTLIKTNKHILVHAGSRGRRVEVYKPFIFSLTSFLLCATDMTSFSFDVASKDGELPHFAEYDIQIGKPTGDPILVGRGNITFDASHINAGTVGKIVIRRSFERASVFVNPMQDPYQIYISPDYYQASESIARTVSMPPKSGVILPH